QDSTAHPVIIMNLAVDRSCRRISENLLLSAQEVWHATSSGSCITALPEDPRRLHRSSDHPIIRSSTKTAAGIQAARKEVWLRLVQVVDSRAACMHHALCCI
ncbi:MAG TPA: hypothetical protein VF078_07730, partial [Nitrospira sp.]